uniref:Protein XRI1 n=1 Tax=Zea mays TaxID=4577 RepID=A0A804QAQ5_MAIZE
MPSSVCLHPASLTVHSVFTHCLPHSRPSPAAATPSHGKGGAADGGEASVAAPHDGDGCRWYDRHLLRQLQQQWQWRRRRRLLRARVGAASAGAVRLLRAPHRRRPRPLPALRHRHGAGAARAAAVGARRGRRDPRRAGRPSPDDDNDDGDDPLSSIFSAGLAPAAEGAVCPAAAEAEPLPSSSSSNCRGGDPRAGGVDLQPQGQMQQGTARARGRAGTPPLPRTSAPSLKRATREESSSEHAAAAAAEECSQSGGGSKRRKGAGVVRPFALLKPDGLDGGATLADINARILMRPARPVRHPVGEFACAPRVSADQPGFSGKAVASLTRLHTPGGRGTITIIRTRG